MGNKAGGRDGDGARGHLQGGADWRDLLPIPEGYLADLDEHRAEVAALIAAIRARSARPDSD